VKTMVFFNNKVGVGKTSLVYHLGWTFPRRAPRKTTSKLRQIGSGKRSRRVRRPPACGNLWGDG
jgi:hypothetical protein